MRYPTYCFFFLVSTFNFAQDSLLHNKNKIGLSISPDYCYRKLISDESVQWIADHRDSLEVPKFSYTAGFSYAYEISKNLDLEFGLFFSNKGQRTKTYQPTWVPPQTINDPLIPQFIQTNIGYLYIDAPVRLLYYLTDSKMKFFLSAGISTNFFLIEISKSEYVYSNGEMMTTKSVSNNGFSRINLAYCIGTGIHYTLSEKIDVRIEPIFRQSFLSVINAPIRGYLFSGGLLFGTYYNF